MHVTLYLKNSFSDIKLCAKLSAYINELKKSKKMQSAAKMHRKNKTTNDF